MDHVGYKVVQRLPKKRRLISKLRQAAAMKVQTMPPVPDEFPACPAKSKAVQAFSCAIRAYRVYKSWPGVDDVNGYSSVMRDRLGDQLGVIRPRLRYAHRRQISVPT
jgi:hypothetical protein